MTSTTHKERYVAGVLDETTARLALKLVNRRKAAVAAYEAKVRHAQQHGHNVVYCVHGTYVGDPFGPDYMCGHCESGEPEDIYAAALAEAKRRTAKTARWMSAAVDLHLEGLLTDEGLKHVFERVFREHEL